MDQPQPFLQRLAGLVKNVLSKQAGRASLTRLAAATAQKEWAVRLGIEWLAAMGHISLIAEEGEASDVDEAGVESNPLRITAGGETDPSEAAVLLEQIQILLDETHAYRAYFLRNEIKTIFT